MAGPIETTAGAVGTVVLELCHDGGRYIAKAGARYLPGDLVQGSTHERIPETYHQTGRLLAQLHEQQSVEDGGFEAPALAD